MRDFRKIVTVAACFIFCACTNNTEPAQQEENTRSTGQILYESKCAVCHGNDGTASVGGATNLQKSSLQAQEIIQTITKGRKSMPAFKTSLSQDGIQQVAAYIQTLRK